MNNDPTFAEKTTEYLERLMERSVAVRRMYEADAILEGPAAPAETDLMLEKKFSPARGLIHKYAGRALVMLSYTCAANCRYCERQDRVGVGLDREGRMIPEAIDAAIEVVQSDPSITEVIFSGGDPLTNQPGLAQATVGFSRIAHVRALRIHSRFPVQLPSKVDVPLLTEIARIPQPYYFALHIDHPDELTKEVREVITDLRRAGYILLCQSVFLKGINDEIEALEQLFQELAWLGVRPYYIYHCQSIGGSDRFIMDIDDEIDLMTALRERLSGLAYPQHVIDLAHTIGKVAIPTRHWNFDASQVQDFSGTWHLTDTRRSSIPILPRQKRQA